MTTAELRAALRKAYHLGQIYWQQADSEFTSQHQKADETAAKLEHLIADTVAAFESGAQPAPAAPTLPVEIHGKLYDVPIPVQVHIVSLHMQLEEVMQPAPAAPKEPTP